MKITKIPVKPQEQKITRVAAYARVSADKDAAFHSLEAQTEYYEAYIANHPDWELVGIYSDNGISGTIINRPEFQRMLADCRAGKIDLVITKSITRFARNTVILLETIRELKSLGINVYFEKEQMHSISPDGELLLTLLAMYAEEEARSVSENQKWRVKKKFEKGEPWKGRMLGYRLEGDHLVVVEEEADIVRQIFRDYLSGMSMLAIAKKLNYSGVPPLYSDVWHRITIRYILSNEKYTGNMVLQKYYSPDFRTKRSKRNHGQMAEYAVANSHEAIISEEDFAAVQEKLQQARQNRAEQNRAGRNWAEQNRAATSSNDAKYLFTGLIKCGYCNSNYAHRIAGKGKYKRHTWICRRHFELTRSVCPAQSIPESILIEKTRKVLGIGANDTLDRELLLSKIQKIVVSESHQLIFHLKDDTVVMVEWQYKSRSESWTPEMREAARQKTLSRNQKRRNPNE